jgi:hypothetical protein
MRRHEDAAERAAYAAWNDAMVALAEHEIDCQDGCVPFARRCSEGARLKAADDARHRAWTDARRLEVS